MGSEMCIRDRYKAELYLDNGDLAAVSEAVFVQPKNYESLFENM